MQREPQSVKMRVIMASMKNITIVTLILMVSVALIHDMTIFTKLIVGVVLFAGWVLFAIGRSAHERRKAKQAETRDQTS
jgi:hypothetical protein